MGTWDHLPIPIEKYRERRQRARVEASARGFAGLIVFSRDPDRAGHGLYLANHRPIAGSHPSMYEQRGRGYCAIVIPVDGEEVLVVTSPYYEPDVTIEKVHVDTNLPRGLANVLESMGLDKGERWGLAGEEFLPVLLYRDIEARLPYVNLYFADDIMWTMRAIKDEMEIEILREAGKVADEGSRTAEKAYRLGRTELEVVADIDATLRAHGATSTSLTCQSGVYRSGEPLIRPFASERVLEMGDMAQLEIRGVYKGYRFDICRAACIGKPDETALHMFKTAERMLDACIALAAPGVRAEQFQDAVDEISHEAGFDGYQSMHFGGPSTYCGHGLGIEGDEPPVLFTGDKTIMRPGMYITPETGIYRHPRGGLRVEDDIIITETGCENVNSTRRWWWSEE